MRRFTHEHRYWFLAALVLDTVATVYVGWLLFGAH